MFDKNKHIELSIIIPVYNLEDYIERCLISCYEQDIEESRYEVIIINDGSIDGSLDIVKKYADLHQNMLFYSQENKGQGSARNKGLSLAKGEYIWFVDGDDYILKECLGEIINKCKIELLDILAFTYFGQLVDSTKATNNAVVSGVEFLMTGKMFPSPCIYIWRHSLLLKKKLLFLEGVIHEDNEFIPKAIYYSKKVLYIQRSLYFYVFRENSTTQLFSRKRSLDLILIANKLLAFTIAEVKDNDKNIFYKEIGTIITQAARLIKKLKQADRAEVFKAFMRNRHFWRILYKGKTGFHKIEGILFFFNPKLYIFCDDLVAILKGKN